MASATGAAEAGGAIAAIKIIARTIASKIVKPKIKQGLPKNPGDLLKHGYKEMSHPSAAKSATDHLRTCNGGWGSF